MTYPELKYYSPFKVEDVAAILGMSKKWVYDHWPELGGSKIGGTIFFTEEGLKNALQRGSVMESYSEVQRHQGQNKVIPYQKRSDRMGESRKGSAERNRIATAIRHGLIDHDGKIP